MKINIIIDAGELVREKIRYGFALLFQPLRAEISHGNSVREDAINIIYGGQASDRKKAFRLTPSGEFEDCIRKSMLPNISNVGWFEFEKKKLPRLFPVQPSSLDFDIVAATFLLASEYQDLVSLERDEFDRLRAMDSVQDRLGILEIPVVNYYSMFLKKTIEDFFGLTIESKKFGASDHALALTHDVDYTSSLNPRMIKRNIFGHAILNNEGLTPNERAMKLLYPLFAIAGYDPPKAGMRFLKRVEIERDLRSTFFMKTGSTARQDMNYRVRSRSFRRFIDFLVEGGFEIGIHPSMSTYIDGEQLLLEKRRLEDLICKEVASVRQHYLKFTAGKTIGIWERAGLKYDSTLGFSRKAGFRNSIAFPFPLYNFEEDRISTVTELPLVIMDGTFADTHTLTADETFERMRHLVDETKLAHGAASILFHNSLTDPIDFPGYKMIYKDLLVEAGGDGFTMGSLAGIVESFR